MTHMVLTDKKIEERERRAKLEIFNDIAKIDMFQKGNLIMRKIAQLRRHHLEVKPNTKDKKKS